MARSLIALGSNLGNRRETMARALDVLAAHPGVTALVAAPQFETPAIGGPAGQPPFLNSAVTIETSLAPANLLGILAQIENQFGRSRDERWAARTLDLDLLLYDDWISDDPAIQIPHPRMAFRRFVLAPAAAIAGDWRHPLIGLTLSQLLAHLDHAQSWVAVASSTPVARRKTIESTLALLTSLDPPPRTGPEDTANSADSASGSSSAPLVEPVDKKLHFSSSVSDLETALGSGRFVLCDIGTQPPSEQENEANRAVGAPLLTARLRPSTVDRTELPAHGRATPSSVSAIGMGPVLILDENSIRDSAHELAAAILATGRLSIRA